MMNDSSLLEIGHGVCQLVGIADSSLWSEARLRERGREGREGGRKEGGRKREGMGEGERKKREGMGREWE